MIPAGVGIAAVGDELHRQGVAPPDLSLHLARQHERLPERALAKPHLELGRARANPDDLEPVGRSHPLAQLVRRDIGSGIHDRDLDVAHVGTDREPEDQDLHDGEEDEDRERLPVTQQVQGLLPHEPEERSHAAAPPGLVSLRNTSSSVSAPTALRTSAGVPIAAIAPFTMMEIRRQYSASSR